MARHKLPMKAQAQIAEKPGAPATAVLGEPLEPVEPLGRGGE
jgi:hypothetical protein